MTKQILLQFEGFESNATSREYTFTVREDATESRQFTIVIAHEAFTAHRLRFQDGPDVCSLKLRRELAMHANHPPISHIEITDAELEDYRASHAPPRRSPFGRIAREDH
jgi:hypothetical protein